MMIADNEANVEDDACELLAFIRSNFKGSESSKIERALDLWDDGMVYHALEYFRLILRNDKSGFNEKIIARTGMVAYFVKKGEIEKALSSLAMISSMLRDKFFLGSCYFLNQLEERDIKPENINISIEIFEKMIAIVESIEIESEKARENENKRVAGIIRISARINLAKLQIFQEMWDDGLENLLRAEELANLRNEYVILLEIYHLIIKSYYNLEGENSINAREYEKKHCTALNVVAKKR